MRCTLCPRNCGVDRENGVIGACHTAGLKASRAALHMWEEPVISGTEGSGTVFFSGCSLGCVFCQNHEISRGRVGREITVERLAEIFLELQEKGANNINLVTPMHYAPQVREALILAKRNGLTLPILVNTGGYDKVETLRLLDGLVDIYLPDFKYMSEELAGRYSKASDYPQVAKKALSEMFRQVGTPEFDARGMMKRGMIVRHLILPGFRKDSAAVLSYLYETYGDDIYISIMNQYTPGEQTKDYPEINRKLTTFEYEKVLDHAVKLGITNGFIQEGETALESFIPDFDCQGI